MNDSFATMRYFRVPLTFFLMQLSIGFFLIQNCEESECADILRDCMDERSIRRKASYTDQRSREKTPSNDLDTVYTSK